MRILYNFLLRRNTVLYVHVYVAVASKGPLRDSGGIERRILSGLPITRSIRKTPVELLWRTVSEHGSDR